LAAYFFRGWLGYGAGLASGTLSEPADTNYARRPVEFGRPDSGVVLDMNGGTVGPATSSWGSLTHVGIFDAPSAGNLLLWFPLASPAVVQAGGSYTAPAGSYRMSFPALQPGRLTLCSWPANTVVGSMTDGRPVSTGVAAQASEGTLSAQAISLGATVTMASLPSSQPASGSGQLWNNGGVISVA
jgi:hypothetical protein